MDILALGEAVEHTPAFPQREGAVDSPAPALEVEVLALPRNLLTCDHTQASPRPEETADLSPKSSAPEASGPWHWQQGIARTQTGSPSSHHLVA